MATVIETIEANWADIQSKYSLRDKDKYRIMEAAEHVIAYKNLPPEEKDTPEKSDYEIVSVLCYSYQWKMDFGQWTNFIAAVRESLTLFSVA